MNKNKMYELLVDYFIKKGKVLSKREYIKENDAPIRPQIVARTVLTWARLDAILKRNFPEKYALIGNYVEKKQPSQIFAKEKKDEPATSTNAD